MTLRTMALPKKTFTELRTEYSGSESFELFCRLLADRTLRALDIVSSYSATEA